MGDEDFKDQRRIATNYVLSGGKIKVAMVHLSNACPNKCSQCYRSADLKQNIISTKDAEKLVLGIKQDGYQVLVEMAELFSKTRHLLPIYKLAGNIELSTSGEYLLTNPDVFDDLRKNNITKPRISLYHKNVHEAWTHRKRHRAVKAIEKCLEENFEVSANYIVSKSTLPFLSEYCDEIEKIGAKKIVLLNYTALGKGKDLSSEVLSNKELDHFFNMFKQLKEEYKGRINFEKLGTFGPGLQELRHQTLNELVNLEKFCWAGLGTHGEMWYIEAENGNVYPCMTLTEPQFLAGKVVGGKIKLNDNANVIMTKITRKDCYSSHLSRQNNYGRLDVIN